MARTLGDDDGPLDRWPRSRDRGWPRRGEVRRWDPRPPYPEPVPLRSSEIGEIALATAGGAGRTLLLGTASHLYAMRR
ncbi:MAG: hypothetical protein OXF27_01185 [Acidobacteria bacterium]|nr:hypothetical protein [Acidobacteriota bacterium]